MKNAQTPTRAQTNFLRRFRASPTGPKPADWPSPAILRRWLRKPAFRAALKSLEDTIRFQADFQLLTAASRSSRKLVFSTEPASHHRIVQLTHLRDRFARHEIPDASPGETENGDAQGPAPDTRASSNAASPLTKYSPASEPPPPYTLPKKLIPLFDPNHRFIDSYELLETARTLAPVAAFHRFLPPLCAHPDFPEPPANSADLYYYNLLHNPSVLLWYMALYSHLNPTDRRFAPILQRCKDIVPQDGPAGPFPQFKSTPYQNLPLTEEQPIYQPHPDD